MSEDPTSYDGSCLCGKTTVHMSAAPTEKALCHCRDCQKITGSTYSTNLIFPATALEWTGNKPKDFTMKADSGKTIVSHFCPDCGSTIARTAEAFEGAVIIKAGTLEGGAHLAKPRVEFYSGSRAPWVSPMEGAHQAQQMG